MLPLSFVSLLGLMFFLARLNYIFGFFSFVLNVEEIWKVATDLELKFRFGVRQWMSVCVSAENLKVIDGCELDIGVYENRFKTCLMVAMAIYNLFAFICSLDADVFFAHTLFYRA